MLEQPKRNNTEKVAALFEKCQNKEYRDAFAEEHVNGWLAFQIRALRERKAWSQAELGKQAGMAQARISLLENLDNSKINISTLQRLAHAFDVALSVEFVSFSDAIRRTVEIDPKEYLVRDFLSDSSKPKWEHENQRSKEQPCRVFPLSLRRSGNEHADDSVRMLTMIAHGSQSSSQRTGSNADIVSSTR